MSDHSETIHVSPVGAHWEVESESSTLGQAETKQEAEELAAALAAQTGAPRIEIHTADGQVEKTITPASLTRGEV